MELIQLLEVEIDGMRGREIRNYEVYSCDMVQAITSSANPYWHRRVDMEGLGIREENVIQTAKFWVTLEGGRIGGWENYDDMVKYFVFYLRGKILEVVNA